MTYEGDIKLLEKLFRLKEVLVVANWVRVTSNYLDQYLSMESQGASAYNISGPLV